jgi:hypothetical protein
MPFQWTGLSSSTAPQRRGDLQKVCAKPEYAGSGLVSNHVYSDGSGNLFALLKLPNDSSKHDAFLSEVQAKADGIRLTDTTGG